MRGLLNNRCRWNPAYSFPWRRRYGSIDTIAAAMYISPIYTHSDGRLGVAKNHQASQSAIPTTSMSRRAQTPQNPVRWTEIVLSGEGPIAIVLQHPFHGTAGS